MQPLITLSDEIQLENDSLLLVDLLDSYETFIFFFLSFCDLFVSLSVKLTCSHLFFH